VDVVEVGVEEDSVPVLVGIPVFPEPLLEISERARRYVERTSDVNLQSESGAGDSATGLGVVPR
jgi:hypothetical protein